MQILHTLVLAGACPGLGSAEMFPPGEDSNGELLGQLLALATGRSNPPDDLPLKPDGTVDAIAWFKQVGEKVPSGKISR